MNTIQKELTIFIKQGENLLETHLSDNYSLIKTRELARLMKIFHILDKEITEVRDSKRTVPYLACCQFMIDL